MSCSFDRELPYWEGSCSFQIVSIMWLIQDGVMLSIMPGIRHKGQLCSGAIPTDCLALGLTVGVILHPDVHFLLANSGNAGRVA